MRPRLLDQLDHHARRAPGSAAISVVKSSAVESPAMSAVELPEAPTWVITYAELSKAVGAMAATLARDIPMGAVVLLSCPNEPEFIVVFLAALRAGTKVFPLSPDLTAPELVSAAKQSSAAAVIGSGRVIATVRAIVPRAIPLQDVMRQDNAPVPDRGHGGGGLLLLSSGTTGRPKIVLRSAESLDAVAAAMCEAIGFHSNDRVLAAVPLCHSYGLEHGLLAPIFAGSCIHLCSGFDLRTVLWQFSNDGVTLFPGVPFMFETLAQQECDSPSLRRTYSAGGPLPQSVYEGFRARWGLRVSQLYGASEIGSVTYADPESPEFDPLCVGRPMTGVTVRILEVERPQIDRPLPVGEEGQIAVAADSMLSGYLGEPSEPTLDGYFLTGDLGRLDVRGNLTVTGRIKLLIDVAGLKVNPLEVEDVLMQHPGVASCVVIPMRVSETVSRLKAVVTARQQDALLSAESLRAFVRCRLSGYKVPRVFEVRPSLPRSSTGKVLRHLVQA